MYARIHKIIGVEPQSLTGGPTRFQITSMASKILGSGFKTFVNIIDNSLPELEMSSDSSDEEENDVKPLLSGRPSINVIRSFTDTYIQQCQDNYLSFHNITQIIRPRKYIFLHQPPKTILHNVRYVSLYMLKNYFS